MYKLLQWSGGLLYLLNKVFFSRYERAMKRKNQGLARKMLITSWIVYLAGLPFWVAIFAQSRNWIAASVEASGAPSMVLGLVGSFHKPINKELQTTTYRNLTRWLDRLALLLVPLGFAYSFYDFGGLRAFNQWLEIGLVLGYLLGTYLRAKKRINGYLWIMLMHIFCIWLMWRQRYFGLLAQQVASLCFIVDAYATAWRNRKQ